jgi:polyhydroxyalkanoate synthesis repressor PhaR
VNLEDLAAMTRQGKEVQVLDAKTGEDITRVILTQIIVEDARGQQAGLPLELLRQLIMASDRAGQEFIMWYLKSAFDAYQNVQDAVQSRMQEVRNVASSPLSMVRNLLTGLSTPTAADAELEELRRRIAELEARAGSGRTRNKRPSKG